MFLFYLDTRSGLDLVRGSGCELYFGWWKMCKQGLSCDGMSVRVGVWRSERN